jgi:hypothetical protein
LRWAERALLAVAACGVVGGATGSATQTGVIVCAGADRLLRIELSGKCPAGTTTYHLVVAAPNSVSDDDHTAIQDLKSRISALERELSTTRTNKAEVTAHVTAPFEVDDAQGKPIFVVGAGPRGFELRSAAGSPIIRAEEGEFGPVLRIKNETGASQAVMGISGTTPQVVLRTAGKRRAILYVANSGESQLQLLTESEIPVTALTTGVSGNGSLKLYSSGGDLNVGAGTTAEGVGVVQVGPFGACIGRMAPLVSDCIKGHKQAK